jgi:hypothetical protein
MKKCMSFCEHSVAQFAKWFSEAKIFLIEAAEKNEAQALCSINLTVFEVIKHILKFYMSRDSIVGIATGYGLDDREVGVRVPIRSSIFSSPRCPDRLWGPPSLSKGCRGLFPRG